MVTREVYEDLSNIAAVEGRGFVTLHFVRDLPKDDANNKTNLLIENPSGSGSYCVMSAPIITSDRAVETEGLKNVTKDVAGTVEDTLNQRTDGSDNPNTTVESDVQYSGGTSFGIEQSPGDGFTREGFVTEDDSILVAPGDNFLVEISNVSAATIDVGLKIRFGETLEKNIPPAWSP